MSGTNLFTPETQATVTITSATSTARVALTIKANATSLRIKNIDATNVAYVNFGDVAVVATLPSGGTGGSMPIGAGETVGISIPPGTTHAASICSAGTPVVYFTPGNGL